MSEKLSEFERGRRDAIRYWTDRPSLVQLSPAKRKWLSGKPDEYRAGWAAGTATVD